METLKKSPPFLVLIIITQFHAPTLQLKCACERLYVLKKDSYGRGRLEDLAPSCDAATTHRTLEEDLLDSGTCGDGIACRRAFRRRLFKSETNTAVVCTTMLLRRRHSYIRGTLRRHPQESARRVHTETTQMRERGRLTRSFPAAMKPFETSYPSLRFPGSISVSFC